MGQITIQNREEVVRFEYAGTTVTGTGTLTKTLPGGQVQRVSVNVTDKQGEFVGSFNGYRNMDTMKYNICDAEKGAIDDIRELIADFENEMEGESEEPAEGGEVEEQ